MKTKQQVMLKDLVVKNILKVNWFFTSSKTCLHCHHKPDNLPLSVRNWICPAVKQNMTISKCCEQHTPTGINLIVGLASANLNKSTRAIIAIFRDYSKLIIGNSRISFVVNSPIFFSIRDNFLFFANLSSWNAYS